MSESLKLNFEAIKAWAVRNGFTKIGENRFSAPYGDVEVQIEFLTRNLRVSAVRGNNIQRLITATPKQLHIDENDMLQGAGLFSRFYTYYRDDYRAQPDKAIMPVWFGDKVRAMIADHIEEEKQAPA